MNTFIRSQTVIEPALFFGQDALSADFQTPTRRAALNANQLLDVELGLYVLSQLLPGTSPQSLPDLLSGTGKLWQSRPTWTPKQHKVLSRGRALLAHLQSGQQWGALLEGYERVPERLQAYDLSTDGSRFSEKTVGFFRNRILTLRTILS